VRRRTLSLVLALAHGLAAAANAAPAPFDLAGPNIDVTVTRGADTLPIAAVPNLAAGDRIWIKADLPPSQSAHYLLVAAFLSGSTNPPPASWFFRCETWSGGCARDGLTITVPQDSQQVLVFLAPATGGDFKTLVNAVRGRPGAFVRSSQDLNQAALDRSRLERYLASIRELDTTDPARLKEVAPLLARSLAIKVDEKCLEKMPELQAPCLMQGQESLILNDGHSTSIVEALTSGPAGDLAMEASFTPQLSYGYYSPYIASVMDIARIFDSFHVANYQYIPALASQRGDQLALTLNTAPSFNNPKSVLVVALPAVESPQLPPLHAMDPKAIYCATKRSLVLPVEGAPLVFSTGYARDMSLRLTGQDGKTIELPAKADAAQGGFVIDTTVSYGQKTAGLGDRIQGSLHGHWGFTPYDGPSFHLINARTQRWAVAAADEGALIVGRQDTVRLQADDVSCVDSIMLMDPSGKELKADWKPVRPDAVELQLPLQDARPGAVTLLVNEYGAAPPQPVQLRAFAEASRLDGFTIHAGDQQGLLKGSRLDEVASLSMQGITFLPGKLSSAYGSDQLPMVAQDAQAARALKQPLSSAAKVTLTDGRVLGLNAVVEAPRPSATLLSKSVQLPPTGADSNIRLAEQDELPQDARLIFSLRAEWPREFARDERVDVATADEVFTTVLNLANGGLTLEDTHVAVATLDPARAFGGSAFGPLQFRVTADGVSGEWQPLATLVRLPTLTRLDCPTSPDLACKLSGANLFLVDAVSSDAHFDHPLQVPDGFPGTALPVPHPGAGPLYIKLRDDPGAINEVTLTPQPLQGAADDADHALARHAAAQAPAPSVLPGLPGLPGLPASPASPAPEIAQP
jgi:hypothetical protein